MNKIMQKHFMNPQNIGKLKKFTNKSRCESGFCGDMIDVFAIVENGIVKEIKYQVFGCYAIIATASMLSEWAIGKPISVLKSISLTDVLRMFENDIEPGKEKCIDVAVNAFKKL